MGDDGASGRASVDPELLPAAEVDNDGEYSSWDNISEREVITEQAITEETRWKR